MVETRELRIEEVVANDPISYDGKIIGVIHNTYNLKIEVGNLNSARLIECCSECYTYKYDKESNTIICDKTFDYPYDSISFTKSSLKDIDPIELPTPNNWPISLKNKLKEMLIGIYWD